ncbi:PAAR-like protein [Paenibacillus dendritiformis]|uniref:Fungal lipase-like domain-containing protein n=1 Tax=Paenibacillus dendritiformis C454 TaxID=1131935 RepID=H3SJ62_9BACL|nr:PAAR-like protein [Paenibacillus dendritiformis]EHQ60898.1 hypothetical protein PDENDC454_17938 [Paenibacillus dendritiformis C454]
MVTDREYKELSSFAYDDLVEENIEELPESNSKWKVLKVSSLGEAVYGQGFDATAFGRVDDSYNFTGEAVVAFRGTYSAIDVVQDVDMFFTGPLSIQHIRAKSFVHSLLSNKEIKNLTFTGHSLGGALAQYASSEYQKEAVTFNAPHLPWNTVIDGSKTRNYVIYGDMVGHDLPGNDLGKTVRMPQQFTPDLNIGLKEKPFMDKHKMENFDWYFDKHGMFVNVDKHMTIQVPYGNNELRAFPRGSTLIGGTGTDRLYGDVGNDILIGGPGTSYLYGGEGSDTYKYIRTSGILILPQGERVRGAGVLKIHDYDLKDISFKVYKAGSSLCLEIYFDGKKSKMIRVEDISGRNGKKIQLITIENSKKLYSINVRTLLEYFSAHGKDRKKLSKDKVMPISQLPKDVLFEIRDLPVKEKKKEVKVSSASGEKLSYVVAGATIQCSCGNLPRKLKASYSHGVYIKDKAKLNVMDYRPNENIAPFGMCSSPGNPQVIKEGRPVPCKPIVTTPWIYGKEDVLVENYPALLHISQNSCLHKGLISFVDNGQVEKR